MYIYLFKVEFYDTISNETITAYNVIRDETFVNAVEQLEHYYGDDLCGFTVNCLDDDLIKISEETYNKMLKGEL